MIRQMQVESSTLQNCKLHDFLLDFSCAKSRHLERMIRQMHFKHFGTKTQPGQKKEVAAVSSYIYMIYIYIYIYVYIYINMFHGAPPKDVSPGLPGRQWNPSESRMAQRV